VLVPAAAATSLPLIGGGVSLLQVQFAKELRPLVQSGKVTKSVRIWKRPHVKVGGRYAMPPGEIEVTAVRTITRDAITTRMARRSGFDSVDALLAVAQHGGGEYVFVVDFVYHAPG
jgi:hypothetical protein